MIADPKTSFEPHSRDQLPNSERVYVAGSLHPQIRVPFREIRQNPTHSVTGAQEANAPVRVYDSSTSPRARIHSARSAGNPSSGRPVNCGSPQGPEQS